MLKNIVKSTFGEVVCSSHVHNGQLYLQSKILKLNRGKNETIIFISNARRADQYDISLHFS